MKRIYIVLVLLFTYASVFSQANYDAFVGTWIYQNNDSIFKIKLQKGTRVGHFASHKNIFGGYYLSVNGVTKEDYIKTMPSILNNGTPPENNIYLTASGATPNIIGFIFYDQRKQHFNGRGLLGGVMELIAPNKLHWTLNEKEGVWEYTEGDLIDTDIELPEATFIGFSVPTDVILTKVEEPQPSVTTPPTPTGPIAPSWNGDIAIQLNNVFPTATYYADNLSSKSYVSICPRMFDYTENSSATQGNIYISGIGEAAFAMNLINVTDRDIVLDLGKIRAKMDDGSNYYPEISYISIDGGPRVDKYRTVKLESDGGNVSITFYFDNILDISPSWYGTYLADCKLTLLYDKKNMFEHIIDERYDYDIFDAPSITWYREGYIMFRYMYNKDKVGRFYNKTTDTYFY